MGFCREKIYLPTKLHKYVKNAAAESNPLQIPLMFIWCGLWDISLKRK